MEKFLSQIFKDETGNYSSKRFVGIIAGLTLCATMYLNSYSHGDIKPANIFYDSYGYYCMTTDISSLLYLGEPNENGQEPSLFVAT